VNLHFRQKAAGHILSKNYGQNFTQRCIKHHLNNSIFLNFLRNHFHQDVANLMRAVSLVSSLVTSAMAEEFSHSLQVTETTLDVNKAVC
jgi:hypothetical protein